jgi:hypothetical protein
MSLLYDASLVITPTAYKESKLYALKPQSGLGDMTVTRATTATRVNAAGLVEEVPYNLFQYSEQFDNGVWVKTSVSVTANTTTAPNGTLTADLVLATLSGSFINQNVVGTIGNNYTVSFFIKNNDTILSRHLVRSSTTVIDARLTWNGSVLESLNNVIGTSTFEDYGGGWYKIVSTYIAIETNQNLRIFPINNTETNKSVYLWGAQLVEGTQAKDYFPTTNRLNVPRIDYSNGGCPSILVEPQRTNLVLMSDQFDNNYWTKRGGSFITQNSTISPDGTNNGFIFGGDGTSGFKELIALKGSTLFSGTTYTYSFYAKANTNNFIQLLFTANSFAGALAANFNLLNGTLGTVVTGVNATITSVGNGWYKCTATATATATNSINIFILGLVSSETAPRVESTTLNTSVYIWGAQLE